MPPKNNDQGRPKMRSRDISLPPGLKGAVCSAIFSRTLCCPRCRQNVRRHDFERHIGSCGSSNGPRVPEAA
jgi:hypothetical protein